jgi:hypothetical protein
VFVYLWDADGPGNYAGVTDDESAAMAAAESHLTAGEAGSARVEQAFANMGGLWMKSGYQRSGTGWSASLGDDGSVTWAPFCKPALAAS